MAVLPPLIARRCQRVACGWLAAVAVVAAEPAPAPTPLRVGVYDNSPKVYRDRRGNPAGLFIELFDAIAARESWQVDYVDCEWNACLQLLEAGQLDVMPDVAYSDERAQRFEFHQLAVSHSWSTLLVRRDSQIQAAPDLAGARIAVLRGGVREPALARMMAGLALDYRALAVDSLSEGLQAVVDGEAEALVSSSFYAGRHALPFGLRETAIVFNPAALYFATPKRRHAELRAAIDRYLLGWRQDSDSLYFDALRRAMAPLPQSSGLTRWQRSLLVGALAVAVALVLVSVLLRLQVRQRTRQLSHSQAQLEFIQRHDRLTGLPNRLALDERLQQAIALAEGEPLALMLLNIDRLHRLNDAYGHDAGDALLGEVARRLRACLPRGETLVRLGSDEFAVLLDRIEDGDALVALASRILAVVAEPWQHGGRGLTVTASIGISQYPDDGRSAVELLKSADTALTAAKTLGRNGFQFATAQMNARVQRWVAIEHLLRQALELRQFSLHYQPRVSLRDGAISGAEALLRWDSPQLGAVSPADFIPVAEDVGLIGALGDWALQEACRQLRAWRDAGLPPLRVAVNVSAHQLRDGLLPGRVRDLLERHDLPASALEIELTESVMLHHGEATLEQLAELSRLGVPTSLDDFGTGYSSLGYLSRLPLDSLKIDQSFVRALHADSKSAAIAQATIGLAHGLGIKVIAEGVESVEQLQFLQAADCDEMQGYYFSRPLPAAAFAELLACGRRLQPALA